MNRRAILGAGLFLLAPSAGGAQATLARPARLPRIGFLIGDVPSFVQAFDEELRRLGYRNGETVVVELRLSRPNSDDLEGQAAELARMDLDLIVAASLPQALAVRRHNPAMRLVIGTAPGLVSNGFAQSLERPGGVATGMDELPPGLTARRLELLKLAAPAVTRVALLSTTPGTGGHEQQLADAERAAPAMKVEVKSYRVKTVAELRPALAAIRADGMDGLLSFQGAMVLANAKLIADFAAESRLPAIYQSRLLVDAGGLMAYSPDQEEQFRIAARTVDRILRGEAPGEIPITHPDRYYLTFNRAAAAGLGLSPSTAFFARVDAQVG